MLCSHVQTTRAGHTQKSFSSGAGWLVCRSLLLLLLRNQIILVECSAHKHSDSVNASHANKRTVYKMIDVHGVLDKRRQEAGRLFVVVNAPQAKFPVPVRCARPVYLRSLSPASFLLVFI
jgi:hypothetical protein